MVLVIEEEEGAVEAAAEDAAAWILSTNLGIQR